MVIYKYELNMTDYQTVTVGDRKAKPVAVGEQRGKLVMWVQLDEDYTSGEHQLEVIIIGTGSSFHEIPGNHIGTVIMSNGLVWHVYIK